MQNPYDVAPLLDKGDDQDSTIYEAVGRALTQWELFESTLARLFAAVCGIQAYADDGAVRAYGVVASFSGRVDMLEAALAVFPRRAEEPALKLKALLNNAGRFSARRNEIAHGIVTLVSHMGDLRGHYLVPAYYSSRKRAPLDRSGSTQEEISAAILASMFGKYAYSAAQIDEYRRQFFLLNNEAIEIDFRLFWEA